MEFLRKLGFGLALFATFLTAAEVTARIEDRIRFGYAFDAAPSNDDLIVSDEHGTRGRPNARFKKWQLNKFGFRGPDIELRPPAGCQRIIVLGASETFGLYESPDKEYPAQLATRLKTSGCGCYEVVNTAIVGLTVRSLNVFWDRWIVQFAPDIVVVYPTPAFYLAVRAPSPPNPGRAVTAAPPEGGWWPPRLLDRARDLIDIPDFIQRRRIEQWIADARAGQPESWMFNEVPQDRLHQFLADIEMLVQQISAAGARPILVTHATGFQLPVIESQRDALNAWNQHEPRATATVMLAFEREAARGMLEVAARHGVTAIDARTALYGTDAFAEDFIHFNDAGAGVMAQLIADEVIAERSKRSQSGQPPCTGDRADALQ